MKHKIWQEGYRTNRESSKAVLLGEFIGKTFKDACLRYAQETKTFIDINDLSVWGCRLFENEVDARRAFG